MAKKDKEPEDRAQQAARHETSDEDKAKARRWFARAGELTRSKSWDFAIKCYIDGLSLWPEAVEEGHQLLRLAAVERNVRGGKKPGFTDTMRYSMSGKDARKAMLNAERLLSHDPFNLSYMEGLLKNANKLHCEDTIMWIGPIYSNAAEKEPKLNPKRFSLLRDVYEEAGDRAEARSEMGLAVECFERAAAALQLQRQADPKNLDLENELRDLSTKITILKGKYESAHTFQESMRDREGQQEIYDEDRLVQADENIERLIRTAEQEVAQAPDNAAKINRLVELLCRREREDEERKAIALLVDKYKELNEYGFKASAEDIRIRQMKRAVREAKKAGDAEKAKKLFAEQLTFEIRSYRERVKQYPTNNRLKFEYASRLFQARKFDEAIPVFQAARADPKVRNAADLRLGRCFYERKFYPQAIGTLQKAAEGYEIPDDELAKELRYWLARALEEAGKTTEAAEVYGHVLQLDYNYRDVRDRLQRLTE